MARNIRKPAERDHDRRIVAEMYLRGHSQAEIAAMVGVTQQNISYDLTIIRREWREAAIEDFTLLKDQELARIDHLERTYWEAWEASEDLACLAGIARLVALRCRLLGLDVRMPKALPEPTRNSNGSPYYPAENSERAAEIMRAYMSTRQLPPGGDDGPEEPQAG